MTIQEVKRDLPQVRVRIGNKTVWAKTSGRKNVACTVTILNTGTLHSGNEPWRDWHFSWEAVTNAVNTGRPLKIS